MTNTENYLDLAAALVDHLTDVPMSQEDRINVLADWAAFNDRFGGSECWDFLLVLLNDPKMERAETAAMYARYRFRMDEADYYRKEMGA